VAFELAYLTYYAFDHLKSRSIYDFTGYEFLHPVSTSGITYINNWTSIGIMEYPNNHPASYFDLLKSKNNTIIPVERYSYASTSRKNQGARYGDSIILDQFAGQMKLNSNPDMLKAMVKDLAKLTLVNNVRSNRGGGTLVCGSPNEVAPDPTLDDYFDVIHRDLDCIGCMDSYGDYSKQKATVWAVNALEGEDQLCQRMAWSLYEHLNVGKCVVVWINLSLQFALSQFLIECRRRIQSGQYRVQLIHLRHHDPSLLWKLL
jgi:hypothetical protein